METTEKNKKSDNFNNKSKDANKEKLGMLNSNQHSIENSKIKNEKEQVPNCCQTNEDKEKDEMQDDMLNLVLDLVDKFKYRFLTTIIISTLLTIIAISALFIYTINTNIHHIDIIPYQKPNPYLNDNNMIGKIDNILMNYNILFRNSTHELIKLFGQDFLVKLNNENSKCLKNIDNNEIYSSFDIDDCQEISGNIVHFMTQKEVKKIEYNPLKYFKYVNELELIKKKIEILSDSLKKMEKLLKEHKKDN